MASQKEIARFDRPNEEPRFPWRAFVRLPIVLSLGIGLSVNQTRAVWEAVTNKDTEFVRTPKHGIMGKLESWSSKKYRGARSLTPFIELALSGYFAVTMWVALDHRHYLSMPFLGLFLCGYGYVGGASLWQGKLARAFRRVFPLAPAQEAPVVVAAPVERVRAVPPPIPAAAASASYKTRATSAGVGAPVSLGS
jgi:hypothetical protein